jgi:TonB-dependent SusC/RagA subfamily outer membrane receptor
LIRGISTTGNTDPLVIVDGIPRNYTQLDPNSIASISILKDAAAVAAYGMGGANGVILVTTKKRKIRSSSSNIQRLCGFAKSYKVDEICKCVSIRDFV